MQFKKITIITGEYGSGKTNLAVNLAYAMKEHGTTAIVDIDTVLISGLLTSEMSFLKKASM